MSSSYDRQFGFLAKQMNEKYLYLDTCAWHVSSTVFKQTEAILQRFNTHTISVTYCYMFNNCITDNIIILYIFTADVANLCSVYEALDICKNDAICEVNEENSPECK